MSKRGWFYDPALARKNISEAEKKKVTNLFKPLISRYKEKYISANPDKKYNYPIDFYSKWTRSFFYLSVKSKAEFENRIKAEFDENFARLEYYSPGKYNLSYFRHTGQWQTIGFEITPEECLETIEGNPLFYMD